MSNFQKHYPYPKPDKFLVDPTTGNISTTLGNGATTLFPMYSCRAFVNFNGIPVSGTYVRSGTTITVTITSHGLETGMRANLDFTTGTATDGTYVVTVTGVNTFTVEDTVSGATSGNVTANVRIRSSGNIANVVRNSTGDYTISFTTAMPDANYNLVFGCQYLADNGPNFGNILGEICRNSNAIQTSSVRIGYGGGGTATRYDPTVACVSIHR